MLCCTAVIGGGVLFPFDSKSIAASGILLGVIFAAALSMARGTMDREVRRSMSTWAIALLVHSVSWFLILKRGNLPDFWSIVVGNTLSVSVYALFSHALRQLRRQAHIPCFAYAVTGITFVSLLALVYWVKWPLGFVPVLSGLIAAMLFIAGREALLRPLREYRLGVQLTGIVFLFGGLILLLRIPYVLWTGAALPTPLSNDPMQIAVYLFAALGPVVASFGYLLLSQEATLQVLRHTAATDPLTGLFNRRAFEKMGRRMLAEALRRNRPLTLIVIDVDHFKSINDQYGHALGDAVLQALAALLQRELRDSDLLGRLGGEEFAVLLPETLHERGLEVAERLRVAVQGLSVAALGVALQVRISQGVATVDAHEVPAGTVEDLLVDLLHRADLALYAAKRAGRNRVASAQD